MAVIFGDTQGRMLKIFITFLLLWHRIGYVFENDLKKITYMNIELFRKSPMLDGYAIAVRNDWSYHIEREFVTEWERKQYEETFDHKLLTKEHFFEWWCQLHDCFKQDEENQKENDKSS